MKTTKKRRNRARHYEPLTVGLPVSVIETLARISAQEDRSVASVARRYLIKGLQCDTQNESVAQVK